MTYEHLLEQNRRDLLKAIGFTGLAGAWDRIAPLPEAGDSLSKSSDPIPVYSGDSEAMAMSSMQPAQKSRASGQEIYVIAAGIGIGRSRMAEAYGHAQGFSEENCQWPGMADDDEAAMGRIDARILSNLSIKDLLAARKRVEIEPESTGTKLAAEIRHACNNLTKEEEEEALNRGMRIIYGGRGQSAQSIRLQSEAKRKQQLHESNAQLLRALLGIKMAMETAKLGCLLNTNLSEDALRRIFGVPAKHRFIYSNGTQREEACFK